MNSTLRVFIPMLSLVVAAACGGDTLSLVPEDSDSGTSEVTPDAGMSTTADMGVATDGGAATDAGFPVDTGITGADGGVSPDGGTTPGMPIVAPDGLWTWVPFPDARCGNGESTGLGVNLSRTSPEVFIYLEGGGACWNRQTCYTLGLATNLEEGFQEAEFLERSNDLSIAFWDRDDPENPVRDWSFVYVPYCTGDVHSGDNVANHGGTDTYHVGHANLRAYLRRLVPTFDSVRRVVLSGASAGGYGAAFNFPLVQDAFPAARVDLIDDSGPLVEVSPSLEMAWVSAWQYPNNFPAGCTSCDVDLSSALTFALARIDDGSRAALFSYGRDGVISFFLGIPPAGLEQALFALKVTAYDPFPHANVFFTPGSGHTMLANPRAPVQNGQSAWTWLNRMLADDPSWSDITYTP